MLSNALLAVARATCDLRQLGLMLKGEQLASLEALSANFASVERGAVRGLSDALGVLERSESCLRLLLAGRGSGTGLPLVLIVLA